MIVLKYTQKVCVLTSLFFFLGASAAYSLEKNQGQHAEFEISPKAIKLMKIETAPLKMQKLNIFTIPNSAMVSYGEKYGVYKIDGKHFKLINLSDIKRERLFFTSKSNLLKSGDLIVVNGVPLLRVSHLQASGQGGEGHGH